MPRRDNFRYLTLSLLAMLFLVALAEQYLSTTSDLLVKAALVVALTTAMLSVRQHVGAMRTGLMVLAGFVLLEVAGYWQDLPLIRLLQLGLLFLYFGAMAWIAFNQVLFMPGPIDSNRLIGAIAVYLLLGLLWAVMYLAVLQVDPTALDGIQATQWGANFHELVYFSFVTLTTLGYGDITPDGAVARVVVYLEAVVGQLYIAIMIAGLVGMGISNFTGNDE